MIGKRILLVEDEALVALFTEDVLTEGGYVVIQIADRLESALDFVRSETFDAAVLDVSLAGRQCWPVAGALTDKGIPFVLLTGFGTDLDVPPSCRSAPVVGKPFAGNALLDALAVALRR